MTEKNSHTDLESLLNERTQVNISVKHGFLDAVNKSGKLPWFAGGIGALIANYHLNQYPIPDTNNFDVAIMCILSGGLAYGTGYFFKKNRAARKLINRKARRDGLIHRLYNKIWEIPEVLAAISVGVTGSMLAGINFASMTPREMMDGITLTKEITENSIFLMSMAGATTYNATSLIGRVIHTDSLKTMWNRGKLHMQELTGHNTGAIRTLEKMLEVAHSSIQRIKLTARIGDTYLKLGNEDEAEFSYVQALKEARDRRDGIGISDWLLPNLGLLHSKIHRNSTEFGLAVRHLLSYKFNHTVDTLQGETTKNISKRLPHRALSLCYSALGAHTAADLEMRKYEELVFSAEDAVLYPVGLTRNEVYLISLPSDYARDIIVQSSNSRSVFEDRLNLESLLRPRFGNRMTKPLGIRERDNRALFVMEIERDVTLEKKIERRENVMHDFRESIELMVDIAFEIIKLEREGRVKTGILVEADEYTDLDGNQITNTSNGETLTFYNRIMDLFLGGLDRFEPQYLPENFKQKISEGAQVLNKYLAQIYAKSIPFPYTDFNRGNILTDPIGKIDNERVRRWLFYTEFVNLCGFRQDCLTDTQTEQLSKYGESYLFKIAERFGIQIGRSGFSPYLAYQIAAAARHLELDGYRALDTKLDRLTQDAKSRIHRDMVYDKMMACKWIGRLEHNNFFPTDEQEALRDMRSAIEEIKFFEDDIDSKIRDRIESDNYYTRDNEISIRRKMIISSISLLGAFVIAGATLIPINNQNPITNRPIWDYTNVVTVVRSDSKNHELLTVDIESGKIKKIDQLDSQEVARSPLHHQLVYSSRNELKVYDFRTDSIKVIHPDLHRTDFEFFPNGLKFVVTGSVPDGINHNEVYMVDADLFGVKSLDELSNSYLDPQKSISPDGKFVALTRSVSRENEDSGQEIIVAAIDGSEIWRDHTVGSKLIKLAWSVDGKIAVSQIEEGMSNVYIVEPGTNNKEKIFETKDRIGKIRWLPGGNIILDVYEQSLHSRHDLYIIGNDGISTLRNSANPVFSGNHQDMLYKCADDLCIMDMQTLESKLILRSPDEIERNYTFTSPNEIFLVQSANQYDRAYTLNLTNGRMREVLATQNPRHLFIVVP